MYLRLVMDDESAAAAEPGEPCWPLRANLERSSCSDQGTRNTC